MIAVIFEVLPAEGRRDTYLGIAADLRPLLDDIDGFISIERFGASWLTRPIVMAMFALALLTIARPLLQDIRDHHGVGAMLKTFGAPRFTPGNLFPAALLSLIAVMFAISLQWDFSAKIIPIIVGIGALIEKIFEGGREALKPLGVPIHSLACITAMEGDQVVFGKPA